MLNRLKDLGNQVATKATETVEDITQAASNATDALNAKAVRASTAQLCNVLELALQEVQSRPLGQRPLTLTASVNIGITALEMQVHLEPPAPEVPAAATAPEADTGPAPA